MKPIKGLMAWTDSSQKTKNKWPTNTKKSNICSHQGNAVKITLKCHVTPIRMSTTKKLNNSECWCVCQGKGTAAQCW